MSVTGRREWHTRYVAHGDVDDYERLGWLWTPALEGTRHGAYASLMVWVCECPVPQLMA